MRIGTWNLQGRWDDRHRRLVDQMECDIWLLTEVSDRVRLSGRHLHVTELEMTPERRWAGIATHLPLTALPDPHGASAMAEVDGLRVCASILPWRSCGTREPWNGVDDRAEDDGCHLCHRGGDTDHLGRRLEPRRFGARGVGVDRRPSFDPRHGRATQAAGSHRERAAPD